MKGLFTKKAIVIFSVIIAIAGGAIILGLLVGNTRIPTVEDSKQVVYEKVDENGDVVFTITKKELYDEMKRNNGINQLLALVDRELLSSYIDDISQEEIAEKILILKYQSSDQDVIDEYDQETIDDMEENFRRSMILSGYHDGQEDEYAKLLIARENYVIDQLYEEGEITQGEIGDYYVNNYFDDIDAIKIRFLSASEAEVILENHNLGYVDDTLGEYLGYVFNDEDITDPNDDVAEAYIVDDIYYFDEDGNIRDMDEKIIYELDNNIYTDSKDNTYTLDEDNNLLNSQENIIIDNTYIYNNLSEAEDNLETHTTYFKVVKNDNFDENETIKIYNYDGDLVYTIDDGKIYNLRLVDVTDSINLIINKQFTPYDEVEDFTVNNTKELTKQEVLNYYIKIYNYIYQEYREPLPENATIEELIALDNEFLQYSFEEVNENSSSLANYMFNDISEVNDKTYSAEPKRIGDFAYLVYKLSESEKVNLADLVMDDIKEAIVVPEETTTDLDLIAEGPYGAEITWESSEPEVISNDGVVTIPEENESVELKYTINIFGSKEAGTVRVGVLTEGDTSTIEEVNIEELENLDSYLDKNTYDEILDIIIDEKVYGEDADNTIKNYLVDLRKEANIDIFDYYLSLDYHKDFDSDFDYEDKSDKATLVSFTNVLTDNDHIEFTAEDFYQYGMSRNPSLMIFYATQYKEAIYSDYFTNLFGDQTNLDRNNSEQMENLRNYISSIKNEYNQLLDNPTYMDAYEQYYGYNFDSFQTYIYTRFKTENEAILLENLVLSELRMNFIDEAVQKNDAVDNIYEIAQENYENFFNLYAKQILIYFDFDEDGEVDDFNEYYNNFTISEQREFDNMIGKLEDTIKDFEEDSSFSEIVNLYKNADRDDETWGEFKQNGVILKYELLNEEEDESRFPLNYSGEYGVKEQFIDEFTDALIALYEEYRLPVNRDLDDIISDSIMTEFGFHIIKAEKGNSDSEGNYFDGINLQINEDDYETISDELLNPDDEPSKEQIEAYYTYKLLEEFNDIENVNMSQKHGISLPKIPDEVLESLDFYAAEAFDVLLSNEVINYIFLTRVIDGKIETELTQAEFEDNINLLIDVYYDVTFGSFNEEE
ncbi:MAG: immunoglobulin-like domain-containing protein [Candidatus Izemoplasmatales bacterium]